MKHLKKLFLLFFLFSTVSANSQKLSEYAEISILTCAPGNELYSTFGHSAIRIKDPALRIDKVYNFGTFNFETPNFYMKFIRGKLDYMLSVSRYKYFILSYKQDKREIKEQILNLSQKDKNKIFRKLEINALPENKYYRYDFLRDNCSSRVLSVLTEVLQKSLILPDTLSSKNKTFRQMLMPYLKGKEWERFGINLALGYPVDKKVTVKEAAFLPDYLNEIISNAKIKTKNGDKNFVKAENIIYNPVVKNTAKSLPFTPSKVFWTLLIIILSVTIFEVKYEKYYLILDKTLLFIVGFIGLNILFLWFATDHSSTVYNQNIIWASPLFLILAFIIKNNNKKYVRNIFFLYTGIMLIAFLSDLFFIPLFDKAVIPLELILIARTSLISFRIMTK